MGGLWEFLPDRPTRLILYYDSTVDPFGYCRFEAGTILRKMRDLKERDYETVICDTAGWPDEMLMETYHTVRKALSGKYNIERTFMGSRHNRIYYGRQIPALVAYENGMITDVYPLSIDRRVITIADFLDQLLRGEAI